MRLTWVVLVLLMVWVSCAGAQIVLEPCVTGTACQSFCTAVQKWYVYTGGYTYTFTSSSPWITTISYYIEPGIRVAGGMNTFTIGGPSSSRLVYHCMATRRGLVEFSLNSSGGNPLPTSNMTPSNWTAKLDSLHIWSATQVGVPMGLDVYSLNDLCEDCSMTQNDFHCADEYISRLFDFIPASGTTYNNIDVTDSLRHDLFGEGSGDPTSGITLLSQNIEYIPSIKFDSQSPRIVINLITPTPLATITPSPTITPTITPSPTFTLVPTLTPTPAPRTGVDLIISDTVFTGGDEFKLRALCEGQPGDSSADLYVMLDAFGRFFFYPTWQEYPAFKRVSLDVGSSNYHFILDFTWPGGEFGYAAGLYFYGAITKPDTFDIIGEMDQVVFGYY